MGPSRPRSSAEVIAEPVYRGTEGDRSVAESPGARLVTDCRCSHRKRAKGDVIARSGRATSTRFRRPEERDPGWTLEALLGSPTIRVQGWIYRQYDTTVRTNTVIGRQRAAVVRLAVRRRRSR